MKWEKLHNMILQLKVIKKQKSYMIIWKVLIKKLKIEFKKIKNILINMDKLLTKKNLNLLYI